jgi:hypothetical protein
MQKVLCIIAIAALAGCGNGDINTARETLKKTLNDGDSAKFRDEKVLYMASTHDKIVCGEFNAKNLMGAYTGFHPYVVEGIDTTPFAKFKDQGDVKITCSLAKP